MASKRLRDLSSRRDFWITVVPAAILVVAAFAAAFHFVKPAPPKHLVLAIGNDEGGGRYYGKRYKEILAKYGVSVDVRETDGLAENVKLLQNEATDIDVAFVCGMIPHHQGAIDMAKAELAHGDDPWAKEMAQKVIDAQTQEIADMLAWLEKQPK